MIDYVTAKFRCKHNIAKIPRFKANFLYLRLRNDYTTLSVKSMEGGNVIEISGNPIKYFQGHNIFGSNNLQGLCRDLFESVVQLLGIPVQEEEKKAIREGNYRLSRVDLAINFRLPSQEVVSNAIREIEWHWRDQGRNVSNYGSESVYQNQHSKISTIKFYNKFKELRAHPPPGDLLCRDRLFRYAKKLLRAEFTLRSPALKKLGLIKGADWNIGVVNQTLQKNINALGLSRKVKRLVLPSVYESFSRNEKQIYRHWLHGDCLSSLYESTTFFRRRKALLKYGIDISKERPVKRLISIPIQQLIVTENVATFPKFSKSARLIYFPRRIKGG